MNGTNWERRFVAVFAVALIAVPPVVRELYPFSLPSMFSHAITQLAHYEVTDSDGRPIDLERLRLHVHEWHDPPVRTFGRDGYGRRKPPSLHVLGEVASQYDVDEAVRRTMHRDRTLPAVLFVHQRVMARGPAGALALRSDRLWRIIRKDRRADH